MLAYALMALMAVIVGVLAWRVRHTSHGQVRHRRREQQKKLRTERADTALDHAANETANETPE